MGLIYKYRLKEREVKKITKRLESMIAGIDHTTFINDMEAANVDLQNKIILIGGLPVFIIIDDEIFPTLLNTEVISELPSLIIDMGAVSHLCNGADLMAPGIVKITREFTADALALVLDVRFSKPIALVKTLCASSEITEKKHGKVALNIHHVGDKFWEAFKHIKK